MGSTSPGRASTRAANTRGRDSQAIDDPSGRAKFGFYQDDLDAFRWLRDGAPDRRRCIEAQVMDLSDDIAYSVHDFEDAIVGGYIDVAALGARVNHDALVNSMFSWIGGEISHEELIAAFDGWPPTTPGSTPGTAADATRAG